MASSSTTSQNETQRENAFHQIAPYSAPKSTEPWEIFINHRGSDVKYTLATTIYHKLRSMGFNVFLDVDALEAGDCIPAEIQHAINSATLHIAIFSPNYAQSPWCLAELSFMLKTNRKVIPIFYHVDPSDLRWVDQGKGKYANAFLEHEKKGRYKSEKLDEWKGALHSSSFLSGYLVKNNEDEGTVLKNIVTCAFKIMEKAPLWVTEHPLGSDELVQGFESVAGEDKVKITGIVGMGGSGKTTLAKELFNRNCSSFERCSFVFDVRDAASRNALPDKQKKLLADLRVHHPAFDHVDEGKGFLANRLSSYRALIVLDDVDHIDQWNALLPNKDNLGSQSMVIVTSRELGVLISWGLSHSCIYRMRRLNRSHAEQLFCWHAFLQPSPPAEFETLVKEFLKACNGLPLSLKVLGAQLYGRKSKDYWESQLHKISRILPGEIKQRLQISYDALDEEEREMFLDLACFFIGESKSAVIAVWDGSGWSGLHGLTTLVNKCLVEVADTVGNIIIMHDQLRDMGREIASRQSPYRVWCLEQIDNMKKHSMKGKLIRGIRTTHNLVAFKEYMHQLMGKSRRRTKRPRFSNELQILSVKSNDLTEEFASLSEGLVWLKWVGFPLRNVPSWLTLKNLRVLQLYQPHNLEELWQDNADPPLQLRQLIITGCQKLERLPSSIRHLQYLKELVVTNFYSSSLSEEFCALQSLEYLFLRSPRLSSLPVGFGNLTNLQKLSLYSCKQLSMLPDSFSQLIHLKDLDLSGCEMVSALPAGLGNLTSLQKLNLYSCKQLSMLPDSFSQLIHLKDLGLSGCEMLHSLPAGFGNLISLENLSLYSCKQLSVLPDSFSQLIHLKDLDLSGCEMLSSLPIDFGNLISLQKLRLYSCKQLSMLPDSFSHLIYLNDLNLSGCEMLSSLPIGFGNLINLRKISLQYCKQLSMLPDSFSQLICLKVLYLSDCEMLSSLLAGWGNLINLRKITLQYFKQFSLFPDFFSQLIHLEVLHITYCEMLSSLPASFGNLISLQNISLYSCRQLSTLPDSFNQLIHLRVLNLSFCEMLSSLPTGFGNLISLQNIRLLYCKQLSMLPDSFSELVHLEELNLSGCEMLSSLPVGFGNLRSLRKIDMKYCKQLSMLPNSFSQLTNLEDLDLSVCTMLSSLPLDFGNLISLHNLKLKSCKQLSMLPDSFSQLIHLNDLDLSGCEMLSSLPTGFGNLISLRNINLQYCKQLSMLPGSFCQLTNLEVLDLSDRNMLSSLPADFAI